MAQGQRLPMEQPDRLTHYSGEFGGVIAVNRKHPPERRRATLVHEYGHLITDRRYKPGIDYLSFPGRKPANERFAESFSMAFPMPFKGIIHVAGINKLWRASERSIRDCGKNAVRLAQEKGFTSIAFPVIGAGCGGFKQERAKTLMIEELGKSVVPITVKFVVIRGAKK